MELEEKYISFVDIKRYLRLLLIDWDEMSIIEFKTIKGWLIYSFSLVITLCLPCFIFLIITGLLASGEMEDGLVVALSFIPFIFALPFILLYTYHFNYQRPKKWRRILLSKLQQYSWDGPIQQTRQASFECMKNKFLFRTEVRIDNNRGGVDKNVYTIVTFYHLSENREDEEACIQNLAHYLQSKCNIEVKSDMAYFGAPLKLFPQLNSNNYIEHLLYGLQRFHLEPRTFSDPSAIIREVPETHEILAQSAFNQPADEKWVKWAIQMQDKGFVNDRMKNFARQTDFVNQDELRLQMKRLIYEFNLDLCKKDILFNYILYLLYAKQEKEIASEIIQCLANLYVSSGLKELRNFDLLHKANKSLEETGKQNIWTESELSVGNTDTQIKQYLYSVLENKHLFEFN